MIRLATAFSGIGAIEHALNRMGLEDEIVFACDNGDVNILTKDVDTDIDEIEAELKSLSKLIEEISFDVEDLYKSQLDGMLKASTTEFYEVDEQLKNVEEKDNKLLKETTTEHFQGKSFPIQSMQVHIRDHSDLIIRLKFILQSISHLKMQSERAL